MITVNNLSKKYDKVTIAHSHSTASRGNAIESAVKHIMQLPIRYTADYLFACSKESGKWLFGEKATKKNNYKIIKNAIDINKYTFNENIRNKIRKDLKIEKLLMNGKIRVEKFLL